MRVFEAVTFSLIVTALIAQSLSLSLHPPTSASAPATLNPRAHYGSHEPGAEPRPPIPAGKVLQLFLVHGVAVAIDALATAPSMKTSPGKPAGSDAHSESASRHAAIGPSRHGLAAATPLKRRYRALLSHRFDAAWQPIAARCGYWLGRLIFVWFAFLAMGVLASAPLLVKAATRKR